jgi:hypothetical protein
MVARNLRQKTSRPAIWNADIVGKELPIFVTLPFSTLFPPFAVFCKTSRKLKFAGAVGSSVRTAQ